MKKLNLFFVLILALVLIQCHQPVDPVETEYQLYKGPNGGGGGGGGHTTLPNNLSFPALLADGYSIVPIESEQFTVVYDGGLPGLTDPQKDYVFVNGPWYAQKTEGNVWQAHFETVTAVNIDFIDWGDAIEAVNPKIRRPYRLELSLYESIAPHMAYEMAELEFPSSQNELQGTNKRTYLSDWATVASPNGKIVVQRTEGINTGSLVWNGSSWDNAEEPVTGFGFAVENNVGGKLIFGASTGGWKPTELGDYRITFYIENSVVNLSEAQIGNYSDNSITPVVQGETNTPVVDAALGISYIDVTVTEGGGGGGH